MERTTKISNAVSLSWIGSGLIGVQNYNPLPLEIFFALAAVW